MESSGFFLDEDCLVVDELDFWFVETVWRISLVNW